MKSLLMVVALGLISSAAFASTYVGADYSYKNKVTSNQGNDVIGATIGNNSLLNKKLTVEGRMENEIVHDPSKHEGLVQGRVAYNLPTVFGFTPYVAGALGFKSKATTSFNYYVVEGGLKYPVFKSVDLKLASRLRSPFDESTMGTGSKYRTVENSLGLTFKLNPHNAVTTKVAHEHGDSEYDTYGVGYVYTF